MTFAPIDGKLVATEMLTPEEIAWWNDYHARVLAKLGPQLSGSDKSWLEEACAPL
ncbi:MAG: M24 family metallopeptidase C-terminal domain-containing protein [Novosphingobium sp.]|nr:M24 family metallopeptidase C-terminal domain-containing protein [Novosphingobium sp.]